MYPPSDESAQCLLCTGLIAERSNIANSISLFANGIIMGVMVSQIGSTTRQSLVRRSTSATRSYVRQYRRNLARTSFTRCSETGALEVVKYKNLEGVLLCSSTGTELSTYGECMHLVANGSRVLVYRVLET